MRSLNTVIVKLSLVLLLGVATGFLLKFSGQVTFLTLLTTAGLFIISLLRAKKLLFQDALFGATTFLLFFSIGIFTATIHLPENQERHYINQVSSEKGNEMPALKIEIREVLKPDLFNFKYIAEVHSINSISVHGKLLVLVPIGSTNQKWDVGERFMVVSELKNIPKPLNPHQFDYSRFMEIKGILKQTNLTVEGYSALPSGKGILAGAFHFRNKIINDLKKDGFKEEELSVLQALLLGQKQDISKETYNNYAAAGAIHILAVSGLHVGIILLMLNYLFSPLKRLRKGVFIQTSLVITCLWAFALLAGLSPSVVRAVTMFSFLAIGMALNRRTSTINSLFLSLLVLVLINPFWIFEVGFQLSYLAVLSILLFQPLLYKIWWPSNRFAKYFWGLLTTTVAAQIGVMPLGLFYFHQFPGLFFISNLIILPFLAFILGIGFVVIILSGVNMLPTQLTEAYSLIIETLNAFVAFIAGKESFLFQNVSFGLPEVLSFYLLLGCLYSLTVSFSFRKLTVTLITVIAIQSTYLLEAAQTSGEKLIIFHQTRNTHLGKIEGHKMTFLSSINFEDIPKQIENFMIGEKIKISGVKPIQNIQTVGTKILFLADSTGVYPSREMDYLMLTNSPKLNLERCLNELSPKMVIADGSNYPSLVADWKETCRKKQIPFHYTGEMGALVLQ